jgi:hypothetical protein
MKTLMTALALSALVAAPAFVPSANAQTARERAIQECMALNKKESHDPYSSTGGMEFHYQACMANRGHYY